MREIKHGTTAGYGRGKCRCDECREAHRLAAVKYTAAHREQVAATRRARYAANPDIAKAANRRWRESHPEQLRQYEKQRYVQRQEWQLEYSRAYYLLNREAYIARATKWKKENPEAALESAARTRERYREEYNAVAREKAKLARAADPQKYRDAFNAWAQSPRGRSWFADNRSRRRGAPFTEEAMAWVESLVDPLCTYCGKPADSIDHIVPIVNGGTGERENLTPACMPCNRRKSKMSVEAFLRLLEKEKDG
jgi:5-methylcytosine-specific restriction endonuclease McrA